MDSQAQLQRNQAEEPIRIHHPEEDKGPSKVLKKVKEKAKKIKKALTKHGHDHGEQQHIPDDHDLDQDDTEDYDHHQDQQIHGGAPKKTHIPVNKDEDEIIPPGTKAFPVASSSHPKSSDPTRRVEPVRGSYTSHGHEAQPSRPGRDAAILTPHNTPVSFSSSTESTPEKSHGYDIKPESKPGREIPVRSHEFDVKSGTDLPTRTESEEKQEPNQSSYSDKIASATSVLTDKAVAAKNAVASKLGYPGTETENQDKGVSAKEYLSEKLSPGEEDKALSEVVTEKLHLGGENTTAKKGVVTQSEEVEKRLGGFTDQVSQEEMKHGEAFAEEGEGGIVEKLKGAVTSWVSGTTEEVVQKSTDSSAQSLGSTVGNIAAGEKDGGDNKGAVNLQNRFQESGK